MKKTYFIEGITGAVFATAAIIKRVADIKQTSYKNGYKNGVSNSMLFAEKAMSDFSAELKKLTEPVIEENLELREKYTKLISDYEALIEEYDSLASDFGDDEDDEDYYFGNDLLIISIVKFSGVVQTLVFSIRTRTIDI